MKILNVEELRKLNEKCLREELKKYPPDILVEFLKCKYNLIGNVAADTLLATIKVSFPALKNAFLSGVLSNKTSKIRGINILCWCGKACAESKLIFLELLNDKNEDVARAALFGLVFHQDKTFLPIVIKWKDVIKKDSILFKEALLAIEALEKEDPFIYNPYFCDRYDVWGLDKDKFGERIGNKGGGLRIN